MKFLAQINCKYLEFTFGYTFKTFCYALLCFVENIFVNIDEVNGVAGSCSNLCTEIN